MVGWVDESDAWMGKWRGGWKEARMEARMDGWMRVYGLRSGLDLVLSGVLGTRNQDVYDTNTTWERQSHFPLLFPAEKSNFPTMRWGAIFYFR